MMIKISDTLMVPILKHSYIIEYADGVIIAECYKVRNNANSSSSSFHYLINGFEQSMTVNNFCCKVDLGEINICDIESLKIKYAEYFI